MAGRIKPRRAADDPHGLRSRVRLRTHRHADILTAHPLWDDLPPLLKMEALRLLAALYEEEVE